MNLSKQTLLSVLLSFALGIVATVSTFNLLSNEPQKATGATRTPDYWVAPMDANYRRHKPGKSPMGMDLVPVYSDQQGMAPGTVKIDSAVVNNLGVRTAEAVMGQQKTNLIGAGYVQYNPEAQVQIAPRIDGWIEALFVAANGDYIERGQPLYSLYSPELVNAQEELLLAIRGGNRALQSAATRRLSALHVGDAFIAKLRKTKKVERSVVFLSPQAGHVSDLAVLPGTYVAVSTPLMMITDLNEVWIETDILERDAQLVKKGMPAIVSLHADQGITRSGKVDYVYPTVDPKTRAVSVRIRVPNADLVFKPNMFANVSLQTSASEERLLVPRSSLIRTAHQTRVVKALGDGKYRSVTVEVGMIADATAHIIGGLEAGDRVVVAAQFLIDSESNKTAEMARMDAPAATMQSMQMNTTREERVWTTATVTKLMPAMEMIELSHAPIETWDWPAMTMSFSVADSVDTANLEVGDDIRAQLSDDGESGYRMLQWQPDSDPTGKE